jgi:nicotinamidase-related amidase
VEHVAHYISTLDRSGKFALMIWPYHAMLGGIGHAIVSIIHEASFFHSIARKSGTDYQFKGGNLLTENYSVIAPEVTKQADGAPLCEVNVAFFEKLMSFDYIIIAGQAKSHCVAWTVQDILDRICAKDSLLARKVYLLEDCTSPVVIPGVVDFTEQADAAFRRFADAGMHVVRSTDSMDSWNGMG